MKYLPYHHDLPLAFEGRLGLRVHWFGRYAGYPEWHIKKARLMGDMVFFFFVETESCWVVINGVRLNLRAGDLLVGRGGDEFYFGHQAERPHASLSVSLALEQGGVANRLLHYAFERRYTLPDPASYVAEFEKVLATFRRGGPHQDLAIAGAIIRWLAGVLDLLRPATASNFSEPTAAVDRILSAEEWALSRLGECITIKSWAASVRLNSDYFARLFRKNTGRRPMEWLNERRLQRASQLLISTSQPMHEIAEACGFLCPFYFSRKFKKHFGKTPTSYRRKSALTGLIQTGN
ncbi:transcriptional regulator, AraC family [Chthoniobacter flavus Ellin428]|uniref:Transcriptional regulator, AraC family n=1 Tax=Chthoniobacter flavus Ellin428 TaxID=497964 RepID=B4CV34_9BACT|nr:helix-turn-helix transcriptional regulator [Chthoniobacter flavus]EDY22422.1 transcriptional regulator, AraC family [Chthoniobacter flavus Ellin428]TCO94567.1 AraC family transcriptional regulator [Chthoniobacter flavus]